MCGRYFRRSDKQRISEAFQLGKLPDDFILPPDFNVAPTTHQPVIRAAKDTGLRELTSMHWGLIPYFAESPNALKGLSTINARAETITTSATWRVPFYRSRCLVPADGFYEWKPLGGRQKQPYSFTMRDGRLFAFAGLWDAWKEPGGGWLQSYAIITTEANELTAPVHSRMPVILKPSEYDRWLEHKEADCPPTDLLRPYDADKMSSYPVDPRLGNVRNNEPALCDPWTPIEPAQLTFS